MQEEEFSFSWTALKLLGRGLYSNAWNALSELVANGFDAGADTVSILLDRRDSENCKIYVVDNGVGMNLEDIRSYVKVGNDKRKNTHRSALVDLNQVNGRKGIGKLAALYLSPVFRIYTKAEGNSTAWILDSSNIENEDDHPYLRGTELFDIPSEVSIFSQYTTGTLLALENVDLRGYGTAAHLSLNHLLANQFLVSNSNDKKIMLSIIDAKTKVFEGFAQVEKNIAYRNFAFIKSSSGSETDIPQELREMISNPPNVKIRAQGLPDGKYNHKVEATPFSLRSRHKEFELENIPDVDFKNSTYRGIPYSLTGWLGLHASINASDAAINDSRFTKNKYFNPAQLRVYVRGKLATDRLLSQLGITSTFLNYIEGEISFDILDDNELEDIATSNRQDFDENDPRVTLLRTLVRSIVRELITQRTTLSNKIRDAEKSYKSGVNRRGKAAFSKGLAEDLENFDKLSDTDRDAIQNLATNKIQGEIEAKSDYSVFLSHSSRDVPFTGFVYELLVKKGARDDEIFYTSKPGGQYSDADLGSLGQIIRRSLTDSNTFIIYFNSKNFLASEYCLFEGGAGWATRSVGAVGKVNVDYASVPVFLSENRPETSILAGDTADLRPDLYQYLVRKILNPALDHLNRGREIKAQELLPLFPVADFPSEVDLKESGSRFEDYYDKDIVKHWQIHVHDKFSDYISEYRK
ncbi:hypothetical protein AUR04nite_06210 [Glutamicibacter uratoxydans]|uniref:Uncharacterized protein n=1 Tax=Glutamicibacter uratoxydans TaxID=43667 RepID=A0A4Y4DIH6_GLUUR|nr:ATP-binding protein [Glutamicibacter uratoxydans]GED05089.1 hypothetical protein AUR04nite_06210 [Glutamicibacter uratoxydans]